MKTDKSSMQSHGIIPSKPDEPGTPINGGNDHGKVTARPGKLKSGRKPINQPKKDK